MCMKRWLAAALMMALLFGAARGEEGAYQDGVYRGFYYSGGMEQVAVQFELKDGSFESVVLRNLSGEQGSFMEEQEKNWQRTVLEHFSVLCAYLQGKPVSAIEELYAPEAILAAAGLGVSDRVQYAKLVSAFWDALNRRPFKLVDTSKLPEAAPYPDGVYTGAYSDDDGEQVVLEFRVKDSCIEDIRYLKLAYKGVNYLDDGAPDAIKKMAAQFKQLIDYLNGKEISAVNDLYLPGNIATDTDVSSAATLRAPKVISAIWDGLNKNAYIVH